MANEQLKIPFKDTPKKLLIQIIKNKLPFKDTPKNLIDKSKSQLLQILERETNRRSTER